MIPLSSQKTNDSNEYPGGYHPPSYNWTKVMQQLRQTTAHGFSPSVNIRETPGYFCIEVKAPGYNKEDFIVTIDDGKLNIYGISPYCDAADHLSQLHDQGHTCFEHSIDLPGYIDTDFVRAEYKSGMLRFDFPKTSCGNSCTVQRIIVY